MRLVTFRDSGGTRVGVLGGHGVLDLGPAFDTLHLRAFDIDPRWAVDMLALIEGGPEALEAVQAAATEEALCRNAIPLEQVQLLAPIPRPRKNVFCVGLNYRDHVREGAAILPGRSAEPPAHPNYFTKAVTAVTGPDSVVILDTDVTRQLDFEVELGVVIGKKGYCIPEEWASEHIFGYTIVNDVSARDLQRRHGQFFKGKSLDTTCPLGPCIVTRDEIPDPQNLALALRLNGEVMQDGNTRDMIFPVARLLSILSQGLTLEPGDILATGTPSGVGFARQPPVFLQDGDVMEAEVEGIGVLRNRVSTVKG